MKTGNKNRLVLFFLLVFVISWGAVFLLAGPDGFPITEDQAMMMGMAILLGPTGASIFSTEYQAAILFSADKVGLVMSAIVAGLVVGTFEELGWTGFAVPRLLKNKSIAATGILVGVLWGAWHFPLFWQADSFTQALPFLLLIVQLFAWLPAYRILMVWLYKNTESLFVTILMHASLVATLMTLDPVLTGANLVIFIFVRAALLWAFAAVILLRNRPKAQA